MIENLLVPSSVMKWARAKGEGEILRYCHEIAALSGHYKEDAEKRYKEQAVKCLHSALAILMAFPELRNEPLFTVPLTLLWDHGHPPMEMTGHWSEIATKAGLELASEEKPHDGGTDRAGGS